MSHMSTVGARTHTGITGAFKAVKSATPKLGLKHFQASLVLWPNNGEESAMRTNEVRLAWNTRAPLLTPEQMEVLERMEENHDE